MSINIPTAKDLLKKMKGSGGNGKEVPTFGVRYYAEDVDGEFSGSMECPCGCDEYGIKFRAEGAMQGLYAQCLGCKNLFKLAERPVKE